MCLGLKDWLKELFGGEGPSGEDMVTVKHRFTHEHTWQEKTINVLYVDDEKGLFTPLRGSNG
jgi:hypothetical protein